MLVNWAWLEERVDNCIIAFLGGSLSKGRAVTSALPYRTKSEVARRLSVTYYNAESDRAAFAAIMDNIDELSSERNAFAHGLQARVGSKGIKVKTLQFKRGRNKTARPEERDWTQSEIEKLAKRIEAADVDLKIYIHHMKLTEFSP